MAEYFYNYLSANLGDVPDYITLKRNSVAADYQILDADGTRVLRFLTTSALAAKGASYNAAASAGATELYAEIRDVNHSNPINARLVMFATDSPDNEYGLLYDHSRSSIEIYVRTNGTYSRLSTFAITLPNDQYFKLLLRVIPGSPNQLKAKVWLSSSEEPETWSIETTHSRTLSGGWLGHVGFTPDETVYYKAVGIGTNGDLAPRAPTPSGADVELPPASASSAANNPNVSAGASVSVPTAAANAETYSPMVTTAAGVELPTAFADAQSFNIEIAGGAEITLPTADAGSLLYPVDARTGAGVLLPAALAQSMAYNQHIASGAAVFVDTAYAEAGAPDLSVSTGEAQRFVKIVHLAGTYRRSIKL